MNAETRAALALAAAGLPMNQIETVLGLVGATEADTAEAVTAKVATLATTLPALFQGADSDSVRPPGGVQSGRDRYQGRLSEVTGIEAGRQLARDRTKTETPANPFSRFRPAGVPPGNDAA